MSNFRGYVTTFIYWATNSIFFAFRVSIFGYVSNYFNETLSMVGFAYNSGIYGTETAGSAGRRKVNRLSAQRCRVAWRFPNVESEDKLEINDPQNSWANIGARKHFVMIAFDTKPDLFSKRNQKTRQTALPKYVTKNKPFSFWNCTYAGTNVEFDLPWAAL